MKKEKEEKRMEALREKELEKEKEFLAKEQLRLEEEARIAKAYNHWKDPYQLPDFDQYSNLLQRINESKVISIHQLAKEFGIPTIICLKFVQQLLANHKLNGVIDGNGVFYLLTQDTTQFLHEVLNGKRKVETDKLSDEINQYYVKTVQDNQ
jgi:hypothetical protein